MLIFRGLSTLDDVPAVQLSSFDVLRARIMFRANVLRGTYIVNVSLLDSLRQWEQVRINGVSSFAVTETTRLGGYVELEPTYQLEIVKQSVEAYDTAAGSIPSAV
jgi:hypothetical protein